jgi:formylmethanofuran dehydrogenase subunit E
VRIDLVCKRCGEQRMVEIIKDARGEQAFCAVCASSWKLKAG